MMTVHSMLPRRAHVALFAAALAAAPVAGAVIPGDFTTHSALTLSGKGPWYRLTLPLALQMDARHTDLRDLRVFDADGRAMPYALVRAAGRREQAETRTAVHIFPLRGADDSAPPHAAIRLHVGPGGTLLEVAPKAAAAAPAAGVRRGWLIDASAVKDAAQQLLLDWRSAPGKDEGFQRFSISGSDDLQHWRALGEGQIARLSFNGERIDQRSVNLGGRQVRYLRLLWESPREAPLLSAVHVVSRRTTEQEAPVLWSDPLQAPRDKGGDYVLTLSVALKVEHLRVDLPQDNTLAPVAVAGRYTLDSGPQQQEPWMYLARAILYRLPADGAPGVNDRIDLPGKAVRQLRLRVDQRGGGLGAGAVTLRVGLRATEVIFLARGRAPYALAVGNAKGAAADLPLTTLIPGYDGRGADVGSAVLAGPPLTLAAKTPLATATVQSRAWKRVALWTVLLAGVALLAAMTWQLMRKPQE